jgi:hypothetical protein
MVMAVTKRAGMERAMVTAMRVPVNEEGKGGTDHGVDEGGVVGRRGTNQLRLLEQYLDVLVKHTTEIPPPTALVEETAPSALVEDVSLG